MADGGTLASELAEHWYETLDQNIRLFGAGRAMQAAIPHSFTRATGYGVEYAELLRISDRLKDLASWPTAWEQSAVQREEIARDAEAAGDLVTAGEAYVEAAYLYHYAQIFVRPRESRKLAMRGRSEECYRRAAPYLTPEAERVEIPYGDGPLPGFLRLPRSESLAPVVALLCGADSTKEEHHHRAECFLRRGIGTLQFDGPGQGETAGKMTMPLEYERVLRAVFDFLSEDPRIDESRMGVWGASTGGYFAARGAAHEPRVAAAASVGGFYDARRFRSWPHTTQENFALMFGFVGRVSDLQAFVEAKVSLRGVLHGLDCPFLIMHGGRDHLFGMDEVQLMATEIKASELVVFPDGDHALCNDHRRAGWTFGDWFLARLGSIDESAPARTAT